MSFQNYSDLPFEMIEDGEFLQIRKFKSSVEDEELKWHRDSEDRLVQRISGSGWLIQIDNDLPIDICSKRSHFIPAGVWHRIIKTKNSTDLILQIHMRCNGAEP